MANFTGTGLTVSTTDSLDDGQIIQIAAARQAFEPAAPEPDVISNERIQNGEKSWDILTYARLADAVALSEGIDDSSVQQLFANFLSVNPTEHGSLVSLSSRAMRRTLVCVPAVLGWPENRAGSSSLFIGTVAHMESLPTVICGILSQ